MINIDFIFVVAWFVVFYDIVVVVVVAANNDNHHHCFFNDNNNKNNNVIIIIINSEPEIRVIHSLSPSLRFTNSMMMMMMSNQFKTIAKTVNIMK